MYAADTLSEISKGLVDRGSLGRIITHNIYNLERELISKAERIDATSQYKNSREKQAETLKYAQMALKIGELLFANTKLSELTEADLSQAIMVHDMEGMLSMPAHQLFTATTALALSGIPLDGKTVADFGSADGIQTLVALHENADFIYALEAFATTNPDDLMDKHIEANGFDRSKVNYRNSTFEHKYLAELVPFKDIDVLVANIGPQYNGGQVQARAILKLNEMPNVKYVVLGGYSENHKPNALSEATQKSIEQLSKQGFSVTDFYMLELGSNPHLFSAFTAVR